MANRLSTFHLGTWLIIATGIGLGLSYRNVMVWSSEPTALKTPSTIDFPRGTSLAELAAELANKGIITSDFKFRAVVRLRKFYPRFQAGIYRFEGAVTPDQVMETVMAGKTFNPVVLQYTIPEGFTLKQSLERMAKNGIGTFAELIDLAADQHFLKELRINSPSLEGYIYPATYIYYEWPSAREALARAVKVFWEKLPPGYEEQVKAVGLNLTEAITFASLIELETSHDDEKPLVSEVIWKRLKMNSPLGIDAAIIYGIPNYSGDLKWVHLKDAKNPYNTRIHRGLPPTPIGSPASSSLAAVLTPSSYGYLYYALDSDLPDGRHRFSRTASEHNAVVKKLVQATKRPVSSRQRSISSDANSRTDSEKPVPH